MKCFLPLLFIAYLGGITLFTHSHVVNGVIIVHSHPFKGQHEHTEVQLETIFYLASFVSSSLPLLPLPLPPITRIFLFLAYFGCFGRLFMVSRSVCVSSTLF